jgi:hypothetical protein
LLDLIESHATEDEAVASFGKEKRSKGKKKKSEKESADQESDELGDEE